MANEPDLKDLKDKEKPLGQDDLEGIVGGLPDGGSGNDTKPHGSTGSEEEVEA